MGEIGDVAIFPPLPGRRADRTLSEHAVSPERAAAILHGVELYKYMVFTLPGLAAGCWFRRKFALPYEWVMRGLNGYVEYARGKAGTSPAHTNRTTP